MKDSSSTDPVTSPVTVRNRLIWVNAPLQPSYLIIYCHTHSLGDCGSYKSICFSVCLSVYVFHCSYLCCYAMACSAVVPMDETLNRGPLALLLRRQFEFPSGINIVQFSFSFFFAAMGPILKKIGLN